MSAVLSATARPNPWRPALLSLGLVLAALGILYADTVVAMVTIWHRSETFAHAFLVPPISAWLIWRRRHDLALMTPQPQPLVLLPMAAFAGMWLLSDLVVVNAGAQFAWVALLVLAVPAVLGFQVAHAVLFPLLFLFFAVPMGEFMLEPMMFWTAEFTIAALQMSGIPVYREGLHFVIPSGRWSVVEACSGVRYLIASFMVGTLFAYLNYRSWKRRALFMAVSIAVPIVANWLRAYGIVMLGHVSGNTIAVGVDHLIYGWVFFGVVVLLMFMIGARWSEPEFAAVAASAGQRPDIAPAAAPRSTPVWPSTVVAAVAVLVLPHAALWGVQQVEQGVSAPQLVLPSQLGEAWNATAESASYRPRFVNPAAEVQRQYAATGPEGSAAGIVGVHIAYYRHQGPESKLVSSVNTLVHSEDSHWQRVASRSAVLDTGGGPLHWQTAEVLERERPGQRRARLTVWRLYWVNGHWVGSDVQAKLVGALTRLQGQGDDGAALVLWTDADTPEQADAKLRAFARDQLPALYELLQRTRSQR
jgi:exosortase A